MRGHCHGVVLLEAAETFIAAESLGEILPDNASDTDEGDVAPFHAPLPAGLRPQWPAEWHDIIRAVRESRHRVFWEVFAGAAVLTTAFANAGWDVGPPIVLLRALQYPQS